MSTSFKLERSIFSTGQLALPATWATVTVRPCPQPCCVPAIRISCPTDRSRALALTVSRFSPSDPNLHNAALQAVALSAGDEFAVGDVLELKFGSELQAIQFLGHLTAFRPYGSADFHFSPDTVLEYGYSTSRPDTRAEKGFDSAPADLSEANPRVSLLGFSPKIESAHHQEVSLSHRIKNTNFQIAAFYDHVTDPALTGVGDVTAAGGFLIPDMSSGTFSYSGRSLDASGMRLVLQHKFASDLTATSGLRLRWSARPDPA